MGKTLLLSLGTFAAAIILFTLPAHSQSNLSWDSPHNITDDNDVSTEGTLLYAYHFGGGGMLSATVNGVTFQPFAINSNPYTTHGLVTIRNSGSNSSVGSTNAPFTNLSSGYQAILSNAASSGGAGIIQLDLTGIPTGHWYQFEWWLNNSSSSAIAGIMSTKATGPSTALHANTSTHGSGDGGLGQYMTGTFYANSSTATLNFSSAGSSFLTTINAFQLRNMDGTTIPEPSTWALLGIGGAGCMVMLRRRRAAGR